MLQVHTQGIAQWVERWSFVSMGEDMETWRLITCILKKIHYYDYIVILFKHRHVQLPFTVFQDK